MKTFSAMTLAVAVVSLCAAPVTAGEASVIDVADPVVCGPTRITQLLKRSGPTPPAAPTTEYSHGDPTAEEQLVLEMINRAREDPWAEGTRLGIDITEGLDPGDVPLVKPQPPLAFNPLLIQIARLHCQNMYDYDFFDHVDHLGDWPDDRMTAAGYNYIAYGENICAGSGSTLTVDDMEDALMVDGGYPQRAHRKNLLHIYAWASFREIGIGYLAFGSPNALGHSKFLTQDFGTEASSQAFIVGVIYDDANSNDFYDIGEGLAGVTVMPDDGTYYAVSSTSGGFAIPVTTSGTLTITMSGGPLTGFIIKTVDVSPSGDAVKLDGLASEASIPVDITTTSFPDATEAEPYSQTIQTSGGIAPFFWSLASGSLPDGLGLDPDTGVVSGTPTVPNTFNFEVQVTDSAPVPTSDTQALSITVAPDTTPPSLAVSSFILSGTATDDRGSVIVEVDGTTVPLASGDWTSAELPLLASPVNVVARDPNLNETTAVVAVSVP